MTFHDKQKGNLHDLFCQLQVFINTGVLLGYVSNFAFSKLPKNLGWRFMLGIGAIPSVLLALMVLLMPQSPRWLVLQGRLGDAKRVLDKTSDSKKRSSRKTSRYKIGSRNSTRLQRRHRSSRKEIPRRRCMARITPSSYTVRSSYLRLRNRHPFLPASIWYRRCCIIQPKNF